MKEFPGLKILAILLISIFAGGCATDKTPPGGPPDLSPLSITASSPEPGTVNVSPKTIRLGFSHYVSRSALSKSIFFSPIIPDYEITVHGKEADIRLYTPLKPGRTYTLTLQKPLKGIYGNQLDRSWALAFSTGPAIDKGTIDGTVWTNRMAPASNITVMAYAPGATETRKSDSAALLPDYIAQTGPGGEFHFESLGSGSFRLTAVNDKNGNLRPEPDKEEFGVTPTANVESGQKSVTFRLSPGDSAPASLLSCRTINSRELEATFSARIPSRTFDLSGISISDTSTGTTLPVLGFFSLGRAEEESTYRFLTGPMSRSAFYRLSYVPHGNTGKPSELTFPGNSHAEIYPQLSLRILPADKTLNFIPETVRPETGSSLELQFNLPVIESSVKSAAKFTSIRNATERNEPFSIARIDSRTYTIHPVGRFEPGQEYIMKVNTGEVIGLAGEKSKERFVESRFSVAGADQYGEINGTVAAGDAPSVIIEVYRPGTTARLRSLLRPSRNRSFSFSFKELPPGDYTVNAFIPSDKAPAQTSEWNGGSLDPFSPSDPFAATTVTVRPGWVTENIRLEIPSTSRSGKQ
ncbi:MAG: Ig-like domain-containing protein [Chlorobiaceae bacterium]|nr:Ig-like domain-containing protein [Chlorobiaceae bacterium]